MNQIKLAYINYRWIKVAVLLGLLLCLVVLISVSGGFPPWAWRFLFHVLTQFRPLWASQGVALVLPLLGLCLLALAVLIIWVGLLILLYRVAWHCWSDFSAQWRIREDLLEAERLSEALFADAAPENEAVFEEIEQELEQRYPSHHQQSMPVPQQEQGYASQIVGGVRRMRQFPVPAQQPAAWAANGGPIVPVHVRDQEALAFRPDALVRTMQVPAQKRLHIVPVEEPQTQDSVQDVTTSRRDFPPPPTSGRPGARRTAQLARWQAAEPDTEPRSQQFSEAQTHSMSSGQSVLDEPDTEETPVATRLVVGIGLDPGIARKDAPNEDCLFAIQGVRMGDDGPVPTGLFVIADGMGGYANGREASRMAVREMSEAIVPILSRDISDADGEDEQELFLDLLKEGAHRANIAICERNRQMHQMMGTTVSAALVVGTTAYIVNVGDSRTYLYRAADGLKQITRDHSTVANMVASKLIAPEDIYTHPQRNQIYRCLGERAAVELDTFVCQLQPDDLLLLCSDGLWEMVRDPIMEKILASSAHSPAQVSTILVQTALSHGGADNISIVVVGLVRTEE